MDTLMILCIATLKGSYTYIHTNIPSSVVMVVTLLNGLYDSIVGHKFLRYHLVLHDFCTLLRNGMIHTYVSQYVRV